MHSAIDEGRNSSEAKIHSYPQTPPGTATSPSGNSAIVPRDYWLWQCVTACWPWQKDSLEDFQTHNQLLTDLGTGDITEGIINDAEKFICRLYKVPDDVDTCDKARVILFSKGCPQETLPPTSDAVRLHIRGAHYHSSIWEQATIATPVLPQVTDMGWKYIDGNLVPKLMTLTPIPKACREIITCGCTKGCASRNCSCRKARLTWTGGCACTYNSQQECRNRRD